MNRPFVSIVSCQAVVEAYFDVLSPIAFNCLISDLLIARIVRAFSAL